MFLYYGMHKYIHIFISTQNRLRRLQNDLGLLANALRFTWGLGCDRK